MSLYFQAQSMLYATALKDVAISCLRAKGFDNCKADSITFHNTFNGQYALARLNSQTNGKKDLLLDISLHASTMLSTHPLRFSKRYVLRGFL